MNENEIATVTFNCTATGSGYLIIEWICSDDANYFSSSREERSDGYVTSILKISGASNLSVTCAVNQSLTSLLSEESNDIEVRPPPIITLQRTAQLTVIPAPITATQLETTPPETTGSESEEEINLSITEICSSPSTRAHA